jgi:hypothetical protein
MKRYRKTERGGGFFSAIEHDQAVAAHGMTCDFHPEAREEFHDAAHWYENRSLFAGDRFVSVVRAA